MAKFQTRRSVSISRADFEIAAAAADEDGISMSQFTTKALASYIELRQRARANGEVKPAPVREPPIQTLCPGRMSGSHVWIPMPDAHVFKGETAADMRSRGLELCCRACGIPRARQRARSPETVVEYEE